MSCNPHFVLEKLELFSRLPYRYHCHTCGLTNGQGMCSVCAQVCHKGTMINLDGNSRFVSPNVLSFSEIAWFCVNFFIFCHGKSVVLVDLCVYKLFLIL